MHTNSKKNNSGFTLVEMIIYLALFSIVIGGGMICTYQIIQSTDAGTNHVALQEEANFLLRKVDWALTGANTVSTVSSPASLTVTKTGLTVVFTVSGTNMRLTRGAGSPVVLNSSDIAVSNLTFTKV